MKKAVEYILIAILALLCIYTAYKAYTLKGKVEYITVTDTITMTDTITDWQPYDVYHYRTDTAYLPVIDTILDTVTDTVLVEIPIEIYRYDTIIKDTNYTTHLNAILTGYNVNFDSVILNTNIHYEQPIPLKNKWYNNFGVGVGLMYGTGGFGVGVGLMYKL